MKTLYLLRHAKSGHEEHIRNDIERHLSGRGYAEAEEQAERFKRDFNKPDYIVTSPALRAYSTALIFARQLIYEIKDIRIHSSIYDAGLTQLFFVINELDDQYESVMLVGHNPGLTYLANAICKSLVDDLPTCGIAAIELDVEKWSGVNSATGKFIS